MKIALASLNQIWEDKAANLACCRNALAQAAKLDVELIIFPEMTLTGFSTNAAEIAEDGDSSATIMAFAELAREYQLGIIFGMAAATGAGFQNWAVMIDPNGNLVTKYAKIHPFSLSGEHRFYTGGDRIVVGELHGVKFGLSICYDLRFPELYTALARRCDVMVNIANWPAKRVDHWSTLLKARAIENQTFVIGVNRIGRDGNGLDYVASSAVFNANGERLERQDGGGDIDVYDLEAQWSVDFRKIFDTVSDRKTELYKSII